MSGLPDWRAVSISTAGYVDGLGRRSVRFDREVGGMLECLHLRAELGAFEASLRERAGVMTALDDERFVRVRGIERTPHGLVVVSELVPGQRLTDVIENRQADDSAAFGIDAAFGFLLQALPALSTLHSAGISHGALAPGRIVVTPAAQIVLLDGIYAAALERLNLKRAVLWTSLGIVAAPSAGATRFDRQTDIGQAAMCALFLALGQQADGTRDSSSLARLARELGELAEIRAGADFAAGVQQFFSAALPLGGRRAVISTDDAAVEAGRLAALIGEEACHAAFADLTRVDSAAARASAVTEPADVEAEEVERPRAVTASPRKSEPVRVSEAPRAAPVERPAPAPTAHARPAAPAAYVPPAASVPPPVSIAPPPTQYESVPRPEATPQPAVTLDPPTPDYPAAPPPVPYTPPPPPPPTVYAPPAPIAAPPPVSYVPPTPVAPPPVAFAPVPIAAPPPVTFAPVPIAAPPPVAFAPAPFAVPSPVPVTAPPPPIGIAPVQPGQLKVRAEAPAGYTPPRSDSGSAMRAMPMLNRPAGEARSTFPWQLAAAAILVLIVGVIAGRSYLKGDLAAGPGPTAPKGVAAADTAAPVARAGTTGGLVIDSQPTGAKVTLNGEDVGLTPLKLDAVAAGRHTVAITTPTATVRRTVRVEAGKTVTLDIPVYSGWVVIFSPIPLDISAGGQALGNTEAGKILLPPGKHLLTLSNRDFGFTDTRTVEIYPGEERPLNIEPKGLVNVNAHPWAEVWVDGNKAGDTPIANLQVLLGTRVFVFKHPQYGERRITATITTTIAALSVDFTKPANTP